MWKHKIIYIFIFVIIFICKISDGFASDGLDLEKIRMHDGSKWKEESTPPIECKNQSSLDDFPEDLFTEQQREHGAVVLHLFCAIYLFTLLGIVCNDYFLPTVENIGQDLNIPKDVAAATFMATATSMPEFFTNTISTLITESDMGLGNIIGSLMFNTLGVAALSGVAIKKSVQLDWWPVVRDCLFYSFNTFVLIIVCWDYKINFIESLVMVILCVFYYLVMFANNPVMKKTRVLIEDTFNCCHNTRYDFTVPAERSSKAKLPHGKTGKEESHHYGIFVISQKNLTLDSSSISKEKIIQPDENSSDSLEDGESLFRLPKGGILRKIWFFYSWPLKAFLRCFVPNPITHRKYYPVTFILCIAIIGGNSYLVVWMLTIFGITIRIPDIVMGLTFLSAGSTMPEALSSLISIRKGESGIGVSNALGANSLAILLSLGIPWFIKNCMEYTNKNHDGVIIGSQGIEYTIGILILSTLSLFIIMAIAGFRLRRAVGVALFSVYTVFIIIQILIEMNVFFPARDEC